VGEAERLSLNLRKIPISFTRPEEREAKLLHASLE
jgi:hypothetical protein